MCGGGNHGNVHRSEVAYAVKDGGGGGGGGGGGIDWVAARPRAPTPATEAEKAVRGHH